jgi:DmsE family decaheme c-type cytochrome
MDLKALGPGALRRKPLQRRRAPAPGVISILLAAAALAAAPVVYGGPQDDKPAAETAKPAADAAKSAEDAKPPVPAAPATYVGSETCQACHDEIFAKFQKNRHVLIETQPKFEKWNKQACESCHGPGSKHAESADKNDIVQPSRLSAAAADKTCLTCHLNQRTHAGRIHGGHARNSVSCTSCHSMHAAPKTTSLDCTSCHAGQWAQFNKPFGHTLGRNTMKCTDCHNPHGGMIAQSVVTRSMRAFGANEPGCFSCHGDKRGPFAFEHPPMRQDGCMSCHQPHNSVNPRMLSRPQVHLTCLECHSNLAQIRPNPAPGTPLGGVPPAFHDLSNPRFRQCTVCHVKIHGSHVNRDFMR